MALTYGVPSVGAAFLRSGLPSRRIAMDVVHRFPPPEEAPEDDDANLIRWIDGLSGLDPTETFSDPLDSSLWSDFIAPTTAPARRWSRTVSTIAVS